MRVVEFTAALSFDRPPAALRVVLDAGLPGETLVRDYATLGPLGAPTSDSLHVWVPLPAGDGRHTISLEAADSAGRRERGTFERAFRIPTADYTVTRLDGGGRDAEVLGLNDAGDAAGWVADAQGRKRPAVWRGGRLALLPAADTGDVVASRVNGAGDVLGGGAYSGARPRVWRADGRVLEVGPVAIPNLSQGGTDWSCCTRGVDLTEGRVALAAGPGVVALDVAAGTSRLVSDAPHADPVSMNDRGQIVGRGINPQGGVGVVGFGVSGVATPDDRYCLPTWGRNPRNMSPVALGPAGELLAAGGCGGLLFAAPATGTIGLAALMGTGTDAAMSRDGRVVANHSHPDSALYVWRVGDAAARRVQAVTAGLRLEQMRAVNAAGVIAVGAVDLTSGRRAALLLTPAGR